MYCCHGAASTPSQPDPTPIPTHVMIASEAKNLEKKGVASEAFTHKIPLPIM